MLKKTLSFILALSVIFGLVGCTKPAPSADEENGQTEKVENNPSILEELFTKEITLHADLFSGEDMEAFDTDAYVEEQGFISAKVNDDGSVTVTMTNKRYNEVLAETASSIETAFSELVEAEDTPYIKGFSHNDDFTEVTMKVDKAAYEKAFDLTPLVVSILVVYYHSLAEIDFHVTVTVMDNDTGEVINTSSYPVEED